MQITDTDRALIVMEYKESKAAAVRYIRSITQCDLRTALRILYDVLHAAGVNVQ